MLWRELFLTSQSGTPGYVNENKLYAWGATTAGMQGFYLPATHSIAQLSAGGNHFVATTSTGKLLTWGLGTSGQLGDGFALTRSVPTQIGNDSWTSVSAGSSHTLAIRSDGALFVWGVNTSYILGDGTSVNKSSPTQIANSLSWNSVTAGINHNLAIALDGTLYAWGVNNAGQLGLGTTLDRSSPVQVNTSSWTSVSAGYSFSTAIDTSGRLFTWGLNSGSLLGDNTTINKSSIVQVNAGPIGTTTSWTKIAAGPSHTLAISSTNSLYTWGLNTAILLVNEPRSWTSLSLGSGHGAAIRSDGLLYIWGTNNAGQLGTGDTSNRSSPVLVGTSSWTSVGVGGSTTVAIKSDGSLWAWGLGTTGQLGYGTASSRSSPVQIGSDTNWSGVNVGPNHTVVVKTDKTAYAWGLNSSGQLGDNSSINKSSPVQVNTGTVTSWTSVAAGTDHTLGITDIGLLYGWGKNDIGQAGAFNITTSVSTPYQVSSVPSGISWSIVSAGQSHSAAISSTNELYLWGLNNAGQLGVSSTVNRVSAAVQISSAVQIESSWLSVTSGISHTVAVRADNKLYAWGLGTSGQLGDNTIISKSSPVLIGTSSYTFVSAGLTISGAIGSDNTLYTWGLGTSGQLGNTDALSRSNPVQMGSVGLNTGTTIPVKIGNSSWTSVAAGTSYSLAVDSTNKAFAWGLGTTAQLGLGQYAIQNINRSSPVQLSSGSPTFNVIDNSLTAATVSNYSSSYSTTVVPFAGTISGVFNGNQALVIPYSASHILGPYGSNPYYSYFTIEAWIYNMSPTNDFGIISCWQSGGQFSFYVNTSNRLVFQYNNATGDATVTYAGTDTLVSKNTWVHVAIQRLNGILQLFVNGVGDFTSDNTYNTISYTGGVGKDLKIGIGADNTSPAIGYISNLRFINSPTDFVTLQSALVYTNFAGFTPPSLAPLATSGASSAAAYPSTTNVNITFSASKTIALLYTTLAASISTVSSPTVISYTQVSASGGTSGALSSDSVLYTWGLGTSGQTGSNLLSTRSSPVSIYMNPTPVLSSPTVIGSSSWTTVDAGASHTMAIQSGSTLWDWGFNAAGQLGITSDTLNRSSPVQVGTSSWTSIASGNTHSVAVRSDSTLWAYGSTGLINNLGTVPSAVKWNSIAFNNTAFVAIRDNGTLWSWGLNSSGQLGLSDTLNRSSPTQIGTSSWTSLGTTTGAFYAISTDGTLWSWGLNSNGQLGLNDIVDRSSPTQITAISTSWSFVTRGGSGHVGALTTGNILYMWGANGQGELGTNDQLSRSTPTQLPAPWDTTTVSYVSLASQFSSLITTDGKLYTWGYANGPSGQLGNIASVNANVLTPTQIMTGTSWIHVGLFGAAGAAISSTYNLYYWGYNNTNPLGNAFNRSSPVLISSGAAGASWVQVYGSGIGNAADSGALVRRSDGQLWGLSGSGISNATWNSAIRFNESLLNPLTTYGGGNNSRPLNFSHLTTNNITLASQNISASNRHAAAFIREDGSLLIWGTLTTNGTYGEGIAADSIRSGPTLLASSNFFPSLSSPVQIGSSSWSSVISTKLGTSGGFIAGIQTDGSLWTWGNNEAFLLGNSSTQDRLVPIKIGSSSWTQLSATASHMLAIDSTGALYAWGINTNGRLGTFDLVTRSSPSQVGTSSWSQVSAGVDHSLGIDSTGKMYGWGNNAFGATGVITTIASWSQLSAGISFTVGVKSDGTLWSWGVGAGGRLGTNDVINRSSPVQIGTSSWTQAYASVGSSFAAAIRSDGTMWSWGTNANSELGDGTSITKSSPVQVLGSSSWSQITLGSTHGLAITTTGELYGWGQGTGLNASTAPFSWTQVSEGKSHIVALRQDGLLFTWGVNNAGQLGTADTLNRSSPTQIGTSSWISVAAGASHTIAVRSDGMLFSWGLNTVYQLGDTTGLNRSSPVQISTSSFVSVSSGDVHSFALDTNNLLYGWGLGANGQLGVTTTPISWTTIAAGYSHSIGVSETTLYAWGLNATGQLGDITVVTRSSPVMVSTGSSWNVVNGGDSHTTAIASDNVTYVWGLNTAGQLGNGTTINQSSPVQIVAGGFSVVDSSSFNYPVTKHLSRYSTSIVPFAGSVSGLFSLNNFVYIEGTGTTWLSATGDWTWEAWIYPTSFTGPTNSCAILSCGVFPASGDDIMLRANPSATSTTTLGLYGVNAANAGFIGAGGGGLNGGTLTTNQWQHVAAVRRTGVFYIYVNGVQVGTDAAQTGTSIRTTSTNFVVAKGFANATNDYFIGYISNVRVVNGLAVYTGTPFATPTSIATDTQSSSTNIAAITSSTTDILLYTTPAASINTDPSQNKYSDISAGLSFTGGIDTIGRLYMWGLGTSGQLGTNTAISRSFPSQVSSGTSSYVQISVGASTASAIDTLGQLWVWGVATVGQLGQGNVALANRSTPVQIAPGTSWSQVSNGPSHTLAVRSDGSLWAWGLGTSGQLGNNAAVTRSSPVQVGVATNWLKISAGFDHSIGLTTDYKLYGWGAGAVGQAGYTSLINISNPVQIGTSSWAQISAGASFTLGRDINGLLYGWGQDSTGQLGIL